MTLRYSILKHENLVDMVDHVNHVMAEGWEPIGGATLVVCPIDKKQYYVQAIRLPETARFWCGSTLETK